MSMQREDRPSEAIPEARGETWLLLNADSLEPYRVQWSISIAHIITDPPYEVEAHTKARRALKDATQRKGAKNTGAVRRIDQPLEIDFGAITSEQRTQAGMLFAGLAKRWVIAFCQVEAVAAWRDAYKAAGLDWVRGGVWRKPNGAPQFTGDRPGQGFECLAIGHKPGKKKWNGGGKHGVWSVPLDHRAGGKGKQPHPTMKPVDLMVQLVKDFTDPMDIVCDPFAGSGTTGVACIRTGRQFIGVEKDPTYFALAANRLREAEEDMRRQPGLFGGAT
jgi:DNA modification methylase